MNQIIDPDGWGYDIATLSEMFSLIPNVYGHLTNAGVFKRSPVPTRKVFLELRNGKLSLLDSKAQGSTQYHKRDSAELVAVEIPRFPYEDTIFAEDLRDNRYPGDSVLSSFQRVLDDRIQQMRRNHAITSEYLLAGAVQGLVKDGSGAVLVDLFSRFGITKKEVSFVLGTDTTKVGLKVRQVAAHISDNIGGDTYTHVACIAGSDWFEAFISHPAVKEVYANHAAMLNLRDATVDPNATFNFGGVTFTEYRQQATPIGSDTAVPFVPADKAYFYPVGTASTFKHLVAPASFFETINSAPDYDVYLKSMVNKANTECTILSESVRLPICQNPAVLVQGNI